MSDKVGDHEVCSKCKRPFVPIKGKPCTCQPAPAIKKPVSRATLEAEHKAMYEALKETLDIMGIQLKRESEEFHLSADAFRPMWDKAISDADKALALVDGREK